MSDTTTRPIVGGTTGKGWRPGQSGNPKGARRPRINGKTLPELAREGTEEAVTLLRRVVRGELRPHDIELRLDAAGKLLTLGWGRAPTVQANLDVPTKAMTDAQLVALLGLAPPMKTIEADESSPQPKALARPAAVVQQLPTKTPTNTES